MLFQLIYDPSKEDFSLLSALITSTFLEMNVPIFSAFAGISGATRSFLFPQGFPPEVLALGGESPALENGEPGL